MEQWSVNSKPGISALQAFLKAKEENLLSYAPVVAIIDSGVDYRHTAISSQCIQGYNAYYNNNDPKPDPFNNQHGTSCAGILCMQRHGGITWEGVSPNCKVMPIKVSEYVEGDLFMDDLKVKRGIIKAVDLGADILSISWGKYKASKHIRKAIEYAASEGRGGKGTLICCASGDEGKVVFPATLPQVICIGACNMAEEYKSYTSSDKETNWQSGAGVEVDVVAPGVMISTIENGGNYTTAFNGTSAACPHVAGVGALILSVNPALSAESVKGIIKRTADLLPGTRVGHSEQSGYGRVNALKAVELAIETLRHQELQKDLEEWSKTEKESRLT